MGWCGNAEEPLRFVLWLVRGLWSGIGLLAWLVFWFWFLNNLGGVGWWALSVLLLVGLSFNVVVKKLKVWN